MGLAVVEIQVGHPATPEPTETVEFLIDSGAVYSVVPTPILERLGSKRIAEQPFRLAARRRTGLVRGGAADGQGGQPHARRRWEGTRVPETC